MTGLSHDRIEGQATDIVHGVYLSCQHNIIFSVSCVKQIIKADGITGMWTGLGAGLLRQCTYTTVRLGVFRKLEEKYKPGSFIEKLSLGASAGFIGSLFGNPAEVALIRMCADGNLPKAEQRGYTSVFNALSRIV